MSRSILPLPRFSLQHRAGPQLTLRSPEGHVAHLFILEDDLLRLLVLPHGQLRNPRTWAIAPGAEDVPHGGRDRYALDGFTLPDYVLTGDAEDSAELCIETAAIRLTVRKTGLHCRWEVRRHGRWELAATDRRTQAYNFGWWDDRVYHYLQRQEGEKYFGLGERAGELNRAGQRFRLCNLDAMGYDARTTDPLYKHIPFYLTWQRSSGAACGLFYDTLSDCSFDFGKELDNYHGPYRYFVADHGDLDLYFLAGETVAHIVRRYTWLTGRPAFMPAWSLGFSGSTMAYTDSPDAQNRMEEFLARCTEHDILCDSFHLSSGYTTSGGTGKRYVFTWDAAKFPDPAGLAARYREHGVQLCANVKPCLLRDHPLFAQAADAGLFITAGDGNDPSAPLLVQFWDDAGAYLDFSNPATCDFWQQNIMDTLLRHGIAATWNDNNEYEIPTPTALLHPHTEPRQASAVKPLQPLLMMRASRAAQQRFAPGTRPFVVSRSGAAGMQRYAQTWSGDNYTCWETLRYNMRMGLGLALSGVSNHGHDVGGFAGPAPSPELFLRWVQTGIFLPRFSIHSWNSDGSVNEPWMYPELTPYIRDLIRLRYRLLPYLYDLMFRSHACYEAVLRPTFYDFPEDARCYEECDEAMLGGALLVAPVVEPGCQTRTVYLPRSSGWYCFFSAQHYEGGTTISLPAPWSHPVALAKEGSVIPLNLAEQHFAQPRYEPAFAVFPPRGRGGLSTEFFIDDGESDGYRTGRCGAWQVELQTDEDRLRLRVSRRGHFPTQQDSVRVLLPASEARPLHILGGQREDDRLVADERAPYRELRLNLLGDHEAGG